MSKAIPDTSRRLFDKGVGKIVSIVVSYDMGWSKRGNGRSYDSLNGYGAIIGFLTGKILDFSTRNRKCRLCNNGHPKSDHDCRLNFTGSAKAMEADVGCELINNSKILQEQNLKVIAMATDEDTPTFKKVREGRVGKIFKLSDNNHLKKNVSKNLYKLKTSHKSLGQKGLINHILELFTYAMSQNKKNANSLAQVFKSIPEHSFGKHENCGTWCFENSQSKKKDKKKHKFVLKDQKL